MTGGGEDAGTKIDGIWKAQWVFAGIYLGTLAIVMACGRQMRVCSSFHLFDGELRKAKVVVQRGMAGIGVISGDRLTYWFYAGSTVRISVTRTIEEAA